MLKKPLKEMTIKDTFMFYAVLNDPETCRELISRVLDMEIQQVEVHGEDSMFYHPQFHGVRLDVIAVEHSTQRKFNVEMQVKRKGHLGKRSRYYHSQIDKDILRTGVDYAELPDAYVIFICDFDPFGMGLYRYSFTMQCSERPLGLEDGCQSIFLSTCGTNRTEISSELAEFLDYLSDPVNYDRAGDKLIDQINDHVSQIKVDREWEDKYMLLYETLKEERAEGRAEGLAEGRAEGLAEGKAKGLAEGKAEILKELVRNKMKQNHDIAMIAEQLGLPEDLVEAIYWELKSE